MQFKIFKGKNLIQGISESGFGSMQKDENLIRFIASLGYNIFPDNIVWAEQVFSPNVHICKEEDSGKVIKNVDGLLSNIPGQILAVVTADCVPILLYDQKKRVVGVLHGSRKCLTEGIIKNALNKMFSYFNSEPKDILAGIGPHIRVCHYWLKPESYKELESTKFKKYFNQKRNKIFFDLTKLAFAQFKKMGIKKEQIEDCKICTFCQFKKYFSARKAEDSPGIYKEEKPRIVGLIGLA